MAKKEKTTLEDLNPNPVQESLASNNADTAFKVHVGDIFTKTKGRHAPDGEVTIGVGLNLPIIYSKLHTPTHPEPSDKYVVMFALSKDQRKKLIAELSPACIELARIKGVVIDSDEAAKILRDKFTELDEEGTYKLAAEQKVAFFHDNQDDPTKPDISMVSVAIKGPDNEPLDKPFLTDGSRGMANFKIVCTLNKVTGKPQFPFRLLAVKVTEVVLYERKENHNYNVRNEDFSNLESSY